MLSNVDLTIGTGSNHVFRLGGPRPAQLAHVHRPTFLARAQGNIYGVCEVGHGTIFRIDGAPLASTPSTITIGGISGAPVADGIVAKPIPSGGSHPCHIAAHPTGRWLYVANYGNGVVRAVELDPGGGFGQTIDLTHQGKGPVAHRQEGPHGHFSAVVDNHLVIADLGTDHLRVHELEGGQPDLQVRLVAMPPGSGPRHFTRVGESLVVAGELDGSLTEVDVNTWNVGRSVPAARARGEHYLSHIMYAYGVIIVGVRGSNTLSVLDEDLRIQQEVPTVIWPRHFAPLRTPDLTGVVVAGERSNEVAVHPVSLDPFHLGPLADRVAVASPMFIGVGEEF